MAVSKIHQDTYRLRVLSNEQFTITINGVTHDVGITGIEVLYYGARKMIIGTVLGGDYWVQKLFFYSALSDANAKWEMLT